MTQVVQKMTKIFREENATETVSLGDLDIVKISTIAWCQRNTMGFSKKFICSTFFLSLVVIVVQVSILVYLIMDVSDIMFCGDIVRHIDKDNPEHFFKDQGLDSHKLYKDMWYGNFTDQVKIELADERKRVKPTGYNPSCEFDDIYFVKLTNRLKYFVDDKCTKPETDIDWIDTYDTYVRLYLFNKKCKIDPDWKYAIYSECRFDTYSMMIMTDCDVLNRRKKNIEFNPIDKLTKDEKEEYY